MMKQRFTLYFSLAMMLLVWLVPKQATAQCTDLKCPGVLDSIQQVMIDISCDGWVQIMYEGHAGKCYSISVGNSITLSNVGPNGTRFHRTTPGITSGVQFWINESCGDGLDACSQTSGTLPVDAITGFLPPLDSAGLWKFQTTDKTGLNGNQESGTNQCDSAAYFTPESPTNVPDLGNLVNLAEYHGAVTRPTCSAAMGLDDDGSWVFGATFVSGVLDSISYQVFTGTGTSAPSVLTVTSNSTASSGGHALNSTQSSEHFTISGLSPNTYTAEITVYSGTCSDVVTLQTVVQPGSDEPVIACNDRVHVSVDGQCMADITTQMILAGQSNACGLDLMDSIVLRHAGTNEVISTINVGTGPPDTIRLANASDYIGKEVVAELHSTNGQVSNYCWGNIIFEDKLAPVLACDRMTTVACYHFNGETTDEVYADDCDPNPTINIVNEQIITNCDVLPDSIIKRIIRTFTATDNYGNRSTTCTDTLDIRRLDGIVDNGTLLDIPGLKYPQNRVSNDLGDQDTVAFVCDSRYPFADYDHDHIPDPVDTLFLADGTYLLGAGVPSIDTTIDGVRWNIDLHPSNYIHPHESVTEMLETCKSAVTFNDTKLPTSGCVEKIAREWTIREWACGQETHVTFVQFIEIVDTLGPSFDIVGDQKGSTNQKTCERRVHIPAPTNIHDYCKKSEPTRIIVTAKNVDYLGALSTDDGTFDNVDGGYLSLPVGTDTIIYTVFDNCHNSSTDTLVYTIVDETSPVVICKEHLVVGIADDGDAQSGEVWVPAETFDNGTYDDCGLKETCVVRMSDLSEFDRLQASGVGGLLEEHGEWYVPVESLNASCGRVYESTYNVKGVAVIFRHELCTSKLRMCCEDVGNVEMVVFQATDKAGNTNVCMVEIEAQDKRTPTVHCPPDLTIDCRLKFDESGDMNIFGTIVAEGNQQNINLSEEYVLGVESGKDLVDGVYFNNCNASVSVDVTSQINECRQGTFTRTFTVTSANGNTAKCVQTITLSRENVIKVDDFEWPIDTTIVSCSVPEAITPEITGYPNIDEGHCTLIGYAHEDLTVRFNDGTGDACFKIVRKWTAIDWCKEPSFTIGNHTQIIKVNDDVDPVISGDCEMKSVDILDSDCNDGYIELIQTASDNCTEDDNLVWKIKIDYDNDGIYESEEIKNGGSVDVSGNHPIGMHRILWIVNDQCGNSDQCEQIFKVNNVKEPTPVCITTLTGSLMPVDDGSGQNGLPTDSIAGDGIADGGMLVVWANEYDIGSSTHPCGYKLIYSFNADSIVPAREFTCADLGINNIQVHIIACEITNGDTTIISSDFCSVVFDLDDNNNTCDDVANNPARVLISGNIRTEEGENVPTVKVELGEKVTGDMLNAVQTNLSGMYAFDDMETGGSYVVSPELNIDFVNGVSTLDLVLIQKHILGLKTIESPYKLIAGDINRDATLSAIDLVELRKLILGIDKEYRNNTSWRFVSKTYEFRDVTNTLNEPFVENHDINTLNRNTVLDFVGIKVGDVDGNVNIAGLLSAPRTKTSIQMEDVEFQAGQTVKIPVQFTDESYIHGYQFTLQFDPSVLQFSGFESGALEIGQANFGIQEMDNGLISTSWGDGIAQHVGDGVAFYLEFEAQNEGKVSDVISINSDITTAELYNEQEDVLGLALEFSADESNVSLEYQLLQNSPNPFSETTSIGFILPYTTNAKLSIYDITGKLIKSYSGSFSSGLNTISVNKSDLNTSGVLYYTLETDEFTSTRRMVLIR